MKAITQFKSDSGMVYDDPQKADRQDRLFGMQNAVSMLLPQAVDESCAFANGGGYIQHTADDVARFTHGIRELVVVEFGTPSEALRAWDVSPTGFVGRYLDDSGSNTYRLWT